MTSSYGKAGLAEELRRRRTALGWTLEQVAEQAQLSVEMLSLIETGKQLPRCDPGNASWERWASVIRCLRRPGSSSREDLGPSWLPQWGACLATVR